MDDASGAEEQACWDARSRLAREEEWEAARELVAKAREMLAQPLDAARWTLRDAAKFLEVATKLMELATNRHEAGAAGQGETLTVRVEYAGHAERGTEQHESA
jgi:hypothetical protein